MVPAFSAVLTTRTFSYTHSVFGLGFAALVVLNSRYPVLVLLGDSRFARIRVDGGGAVTIAANRLSARVLDAILLPE